MHPKEYNSQFHKFRIAICDDAEEYDNLAGKVNACVDAANDHEVFHGTLGDVREAFADLIEQETGIARREIGTGKFEEEDGKKVEVTETEKFTPYYNRVCEQLSKDPDSAPFQHLADRLSFGGDKEVKMDPRPRERKAPKGAKIPKRFLEKARTVFANGTVEKFQKMAAKAGISFVLGDDEAKNIEAVAVAMKAYVEAKENELLGTA